MTKARDLANIISGGFTEADIPNLPASKITSGTFADARIAASNVSQHATSFDDNKIVNDLSTLGLRVHTQENLNASNTNSASFDVFQDSSGITNLTNAGRDAAGEFVSTSIQQTESGGTETEFGDISGWAWGGSTFVHNNSNYMQYNVSSGNHTAYTHASTPLTGNYKVTWSFGTSNVSGQSTTSNHGLQVGIYMGSYTFDTGLSLWGNNNSGIFYLQTGGSLSSGNQNVYATRQQSNQATLSLPLTTSYYLQLIRNTSDQTLKVFGGTNSDPYSVVGATALHTFTGYSGTQADDLAVSTGYPNSNTINSGTYVAQNATIKTGITTLHGASTFNASGSFEGATITASSSTSSMGAVLTYQDNAGVNALNTDIVLKLSADNGSNYSTATLTALPDFATGIKMAKVNDLSVTAGTQLKYKIEFANQASGSKEARIRGVSLQY